MCGKPCQRCLDGAPVRGQDLGNSMLEHTRTVICLVRCCVWGWMAVSLDLSIVIFHIIFLLPLASAQCCLEWIHVQALCMMGRSGGPAFASPIAGLSLRHTRLSESLFAQKRGGYKSSFFLGRASYFRRRGSQRFV